MRGVLKVISNGSFLAVIAVREYQAVQARAKQKSLAFWDKTPIGTLPDKLFESIKNTPGTEGGMIQSASWTMMEEVNYDQNEITSFDWTSYPIMRMMDVPEVEVHILDRPKKKPWEQVKQRWGQSLQLLPMRFLMRRGFESGICRLRLRR